MSNGEKVQKFSIFNTYTPQYTCETQELQGSWYAMASNETQDNEAKVAYVVVNVPTKLLLIIR